MKRLFMNGFGFPRPPMIPKTRMIRFDTEQTVMVMLTDHNSPCQEEKSSPDLPIFGYDEKKTDHPNDRNQEHQIAPVEGMSF